MSTRLATCPDCDVDTIVAVVSLGYKIRLDARQIPADQPVEGYEHNPYYGWFNVTGRAGYTRRGFPIHGVHQCTGKAPQ